MRILASFSVVIALCACVDGAPKDAADFGAAQLARTAVKADRACAAAGFEDLEACSDATDQAIRRGAKTALIMTETYMRTCTADIGSDRCNEMLMAAYFVAQK